MEFLSSSVSGMYLVCLEAFSSRGLVVKAERTSVMTLLSCSTKLFTASTTFSVSVRVVKVTASALLPTAPVFASMLKVSRRVTSMPSSSTVLVARERVRSWPLMVTFITASVPLV